MTAQPSPERARLLAVVADHILEHGVVDLSLSSLARAVGSNNRMLLYYFGSREALLEEAWLIVVDRYSHVASRLADPSASTPDAIDACWHQLADPVNRRFVQLFFEFFSMQSRSPERSRTFLDRVSLEWVDAISARLEDEGVSDAHERATTIVATWRGLQLALLAGSDPEELERVHRRVVDAAIGLSPVA